MIGAAVPFGVEAVAFAVAALLLAGVRRGSGRVQADSGGRGRLSRDMAESLAWLWHHDAVRLLAVVLAVMNVTFMAAFAVWVLYARERLGVSEAGFGLLLTASAVGGLAGAALAGPFWVAAAGDAVLLLLVWRRFTSARLDSRAGTVDDDEDGHASAREQEER